VVGIARGTKIKKFRFGLALKVWFAYDCVC
jgi:hypothetical protein